MVDIKPEEYFYVCNGEVLKNKEDLFEFLRRVDDSVFSYHVNEYKNDFANWIRDVFKDLVLASKIRNVKNPIEMAKIVKQSINKQSKKKGIIEQIKQAIVN